METRPGKCPAPTDSCHAMPILSAGAQPLRRAGCELCIPAPQPLASPVSHPWNKGRQMWPPLATALWFLGHGPCKAQLWLYWRCAHSTIPALSPGQRGLWTPQMGHGTTPARCPGMGQLRRALALEALFHYLPTFVSYTCTDAFCDTATNGYSRLPERIWGLCWVLFLFVWGFFPWFYCWLLGFWGFFFGFFFFLRNSWLNKFFSFSEGRTLKPSWVWADGQKHQLRWNWHRQTLFSQCRTFPCWALEKKLSSAACDHCCTVVIVFYQVWNCDEMLFLY